MTTRNAGRSAAACAPQAQRLPHPYRRRLALILARRAAERRALAAKLRAHLARRAQLRDLVEGGDE